MRTRYTCDDTIRVSWSIRSMYRRTVTPLVTITHSN